MPRPAADRTTQLERASGYFAGRFAAMASPCEVLVETDSEHEAATVLAAVADAVIAAPADLAAAVAQLGGEAR